MIAMAGCYKDEGNYDYQEINSVEISGIDSSYAVMQGDPLVIKPVLSFTKDQSGDTSKYSYEWLAIAKYGAGPYGERFQLANTRNLDIHIYLEPSKDYYVYYRVIDKATGVTFKYRFMLTVSIMTSKGMLILSEVNGKARLDMLSEYPKKYTMYTDVLTMLGSQVPRDGAPIEMGVVSTGYYLTTTAGTHKINTSNFGWQPANSIAYEFQTNMPDNMVAERLISYSGGALCLSDGNLYVYYQVSSIRYNVPVNYIGSEGKYFKVSKHISVGSSIMPTILYDETNHRFIRYQAPNAESNYMPDGGTLFNYQDPTKDLLYMTWNNYNNGMTFALLKDRATQQVMLARMNVTNTLLLQNSYGQVVAPDIEKATQFAVDPVNGYLFYSVGGRLYEYDQSLKTTKVMLDRPGEVISLLRSTSDGLVVCYYKQAGPAETGGTWEKYTVPPINGDLQLKESYGGFGRIVSYANKS
ncbi:PKD-like family lipoprotein [Chitinophaga flava]|nr:PKD-like family lipoprotein [Chitinophaga flava]